MILEKTEKQEKLLYLLKMTFSGVKGDKEFQNIRTDILKNLIDTSIEYLKNAPLHNVMPCTDIEKTIDSWLTDEQMNFNMTAKATNMLIGGKWDMKEVSEAITYINRKWRYEA